MKATRDWFTHRLAAARRRATTHEGDRGVTSIEYAGIVILVAGIILLITQLNLGTKIAAAINAAVSGII
ncbi:MAG: hypothetical protein ACRDQB_16275 [Thermocrispum sp.]